MSSTHLPAQPPPPDYAAANREGIQTDISTLPLRRQLESGARLGQRVTYTDPVTGQEKTADFTGLGDDTYARNAAQIAAETNANLQRQQLALRQELGVGNVQQTIAELQAADPRGYALRQSLTDRATSELAGPKSDIGSSANIASAENRLWNIANSAPPANPGDRLGDLYRRAGESDGRLGSIYDEVTRLPGTVSDDPRSANALSSALARAQQEFELGGKLDTDTKRELLNEVRAGQAARGNYLGDAAAVTEATELGSAMERRKAERLASLLDVQGRAFGQGQSIRQEGAQNLMTRIGAKSSVQGQDFAQGMQRLGQQAALAGQDFGQNQQAYTAGLNAAQAAFAGTQAMADDQRRTRAENFGYDQQRLSNAQALALGAPVTNQFGSLGGAQQGAVGFQQVGYQPGINLNANAGAQAANFAQQSFGTNANMWMTAANIAQQDNASKNSMLASGAGMAAAMMI